MTSMRAFSACATARAARAVVFPLPAGPKTASGTEPSCAAMRACNDDSTRPSLTRKDALLVCGSLAARALVGAERTRRIDADLKMLDTVTSDEIAPGRERVERLFEIGNRT